MTKTIKFIILLISFQLFAQNDANNKIDLDYSIKYFYQEDINLLKSIEALQNLYNDDYKNYRLYWYEEDFKILNDPYKDLYWILNSGYKTYKPTIISIAKKNDLNYTLKIAIIGNPEGFNSLYTIYDLGVYIIEGKPKFYNLLIENLNDYNVTEFKGVDYYHKQKFSKKDAKKQIEFNEYLSRVLKKEILNFKFIVSKSYEEMLKMQSYNYKNDMYINGSLGGVAYVSDKIIFSANGSFFYPHEVVHLYTHKYYSGIHNFLDEGIATYFGGSKELSFFELKNILKQKINSEDMNLYETSFDENLKYKPLGNGTAIYYAIGAVFFEILNKKFGIDSIEKFRFLDMGNKTDLNNKIQELFNDKEITFDSLIKKELNEYDFKK